MKNVTRREVTTGDTAQGAVCMKVLIKLLGLIGSCCRRKPRGKKVEIDPKKPGEMQVWKTDRCCHKAAEDEADKGPLSIVFESY